MRSMRRWTALVAIVGSMLVVAPAQVADPAPALQEELPPVRILSAGDSYAAGEGLGGIQVGEEACQRALGQASEPGTTPSKAWPVLMKETHEGKHGDVYQQWNVSTFWFTACTGNTSMHFTQEPTAKGTTQLDEAQAGSGTDPWDVVTLSFGGNDVGFAGILQDCVGLDTDLLELGSITAPVFVSKLVGGAFAGCSLNEAQMKARIDQGWTDGASPVPPLAQRLSAVYDQAAKVSKAGGLVVVTGYPQLVEEPSVWPSVNKAVNRCERLSEGDTRALRGATGHMNEVIGQQVMAARERHPGITWVFVDVTPSFEPTEGKRHGLCAEENWINGFSFGGWTDGDFRGLDAPGIIAKVKATFSRSYHPTQAGHEAYSRAVVNAIRESGWVPRRDPSACDRASVAADLTVAVTAAVSDPTCVDDWGWINICEQSDPADICADAGVIIHRVDGRWTRAGGLLQDCAESFTAVGAPPDIARQFYKPCTPPDYCEGEPSCEVTGTLEFNHPTWGPSTLVLLTDNVVNGDRAFVVFDADGNRRWRRETVQYEPLEFNDVPQDATGNLFINYNPGRYNGVTVLRPVPDGMEDFGTIWGEDAGADGMDFYGGVAVDTDGDGVLEIEVNINECDPTCAGTTFYTHKTYVWDGRGYAVACEVRREPVETCL